MRTFLFILVGLAAPGMAVADEAADLFESHVRPIFVEYCQGCHGEEKQKGELRLDSRAGWQKGGESGPAIVPGKPKQSLLIRAITVKPDDPLRMPPGRRLPERSVADLTRWIELGAHDPRDGTAKPDKAIDWDAAAEFWAFKPVEARQPPNTKALQPAGVIDQFIAAKLEAANLTPTGPADKRTLIRRTTFDLTGLPPTAEDVERFLADASEDAFPKLVDRLLASSAYGEREARGWLDLARYAEDQAHQSGDGGLPMAWRYRDWVVEAFNRDLPYDKFIKLQLVADLIEGPTDDPADRRALGFLGLGAVYYKNTDIPRVLAEEWDDRVDTLTRTFLGLTVSCARCHDHKYDPIPTRDYYSLAGVIANTRNVMVPVAPRSQIADYDAGVRNVSEAGRALTELVQSELDRRARLRAEQFSDYTLAVWNGRGAGLADQELARFAAFLSKDRGQNHPFKAWAKLKPREGGRSEPPAAVREFAALVKSRAEAELAKPFAARNRDEHNELFGPKGVFALTPAELVRGASAEWKGEHAEKLVAAWAAVVRVPRRPAACHGAADVEPSKAKDLKVFVRGNPYNLGEPAPRRFLRVLAGPNAEIFAAGSGRKELAERIAAADNPLTARVMVNRIWQRHFGRGIVATPSNFGKVGARPTHPELLDYLADRFVKSGWSVKAIHREIMLSETYRRSSSADPKSVEADPENLLLGRMPRRRLTAEEFRDALLVAAGDLDRTPAGPSEELDDPKNLRRTVYGTVSRHKLNELLRLFDFPDPNISGERRNETTLPQQQLFVLNGPFVATRAKSLAAKLADEATPADRVRLAYRSVYVRPPTAEEETAALRYLAAEDPTPGVRGTPRLERFAQALLASNEFYFID